MSPFGLQALYRGVETQQHGGEELGSLVVSQAFLFKPSGLIARSLEKGERFGVWMLVHGRLFLEYCFIGLIAVRLSSQWIHLRGKTRFRGGEEFTQ
jgi:hypothetical protein